MTSDRRAARILSEQKLEFRRREADAIRIYFARLRNRSDAKGPAASPLIRPDAFTSSRAPLIRSSWVGHGTRFSLVLPLDRSALAPVRGAPASDDAGERILIIEDDTGVRQAYEIMLMPWG